MIKSFKKLPPLASLDELEKIVAEMNFLSELGPVYNYQISEK